MKLFKNANPNIKCDLISVDGRHYHEGSGTPHTHTGSHIHARSLWSVHPSDPLRPGVWLCAVEDINSFQFLANPDFNLLFVDDTNCKARYCFDSAVEEHLRRGTVPLQTSLVRCCRWFARTGRAARLLSADAPVTAGFAGCDGLLGSSCCVLRASC